MFRRFSLALIVVGTLGCKPPAKNNLQALDQFAGDAVSYLCKGPATDNAKYMPYVKGATSDAQKSAINAALSAVPYMLKDRILLGPIRSFIEVTDNITSKCGPTAIVKANSRQISAIYACPVIANGTATIYVDKDPAKIQSSLVRALSYYIVDVDSQINLDASSPTQIRIGHLDTTDLTKNKKQLAALEFLDEVAQRRGGDLSIFDPILPDSITRAKSKAARQAAFFDPTQTNPIDRDSFVSYFLAEMLDSSMCSDQSRAAMEQKFPRTMAFFLNPPPSQRLALQGGTCTGPNCGRVEALTSEEYPTTRTAVEGPAQADDGVPAEYRDVGRPIFRTVNGREESTKMYTDGANIYYRWPGSDWSTSKTPQTGGPSQAVYRAQEARSKSLESWLNPAPVPMPTPADSSSSEARPKPVPTPTGGYSSEAADKEEMERLEFERYKKWLDGLFADQASPPAPNGGAQPNTGNPAPQTPPPTATPPAPPLADRNKQSVSDIQAHIADLEAQAAEAQRMENAIRDSTDPSLKFPNWEAKDAARQKLRERRAELMKEIAGARVAMTDARMSGITGVVIPNIYGHLAPPPPAKKPPVRPATPPAAATPTKPVAPPTTPAAPSSSGSWWPSSGSSSSSNSRTWSQWWAAKDKYGGCAWYDVGCRAGNALFFDHIK